jgi:hypothetical protein
MCNIETLLIEAQKLFYKGNHPVVVYYELDGNRIVQLLRCVTPYTNYGITLTMFVQVGSEVAGQDAEFSPEFVVSMDGRRFETLIDPFGVIPEEKGFCCETEVVEVFAQRLLARVSSVEHPFNSLLPRKVASY